MSSMAGSSPSTLTARPVHAQGLLLIDLTADEHADLRRLDLLDPDSERLVWGAYRRTIVWCCLAPRMPSTTWPALWLSKLTT